MNSTTKDKSKKLIHKAYKYRLYPNEKQRVLIAKTIGCSRFVFNYFLSVWNETYESTGRGLSYHECSSDLTKLKKDEEHLWLREVDSIALQSSIRNLADGFDRFFKKQNDKPRFKSKKNRVQSYTTRYTNNNISLNDGKIKLPKLGLVRMAGSRTPSGRIINATIRRTPSGKYYVSIMVEEVMPEPMERTGSAVGIDVGLFSFAVFNDGFSYKNPRHFRNLEKKLAKAQRILSRRERGSKNWYKQKQRVARIHESISNSRNDFLHKTTTEIIKNHDIIGVEDLTVKNLLEEKEYSKSISDASWATFLSMLKYKAEWYGKEVIEISKYYPSTQLCSVCEYKNPALKNDTSIRRWDCPVCGANHDRDINAAINILNEALRIKYSTAGTAGVA